MAVTKEEILDTVANMTVVEIVDLISAMEEKFGVSAAAAVVAGPAAGGAGARRRGARRRRRRRRLRRMRSR